MCNKTKNIVILGPPGSGKGTQAVRLAEKLSMAHISTGDVLRNEIAQGSELGKAAQSFMDSGRLVPDDLVVGIVEDAIKRYESAGVILDGFPRNNEQAEMLDRHGYRISDVLYIMVPDEEIVKRLSSRQFCAKCNRVVLGEGGLCEICHNPTETRNDDNPEVVKKRLDVYKESTSPLIAYYRKKGLLREVDGVGEIDEINHRLVGVLDKGNHSTTGKEGCCN